MNRLEEIINSKKILEIEIYWKISQETIQEWEKIINTQKQTKNKSNKILNSTKKKPFNLLEYSWYKIQRYNIPEKKYVNSSNVTQLINNKIIKLEKICGMFLKLISTVDISEVNKNYFEQYNKYENNIYQIIKYVSDNHQKSINKIPWLSSIIKFSNLILFWWKYDTYNEYIKLNEIKIFNNLEWKNNFKENISLLLENIEYFKENIKN